ncbi:MAG: aminopeptidase [Betaproteobacteria bacterium]|nr:MAG: aminopeptidase [Betaproteobacteria bacterium]
MRRSLAALLASLSLTGCETLSYYAQAVGGHLELTARARPVDEWLSDAQTPPALREQLALAQRLRAFAASELGLPDNGSYRRFADLTRPYAVWNVFAAREFSLEPVQSCFPVAGCVAYRGFFAHADAEAHAARLQRQGFDTAVLGVPAYSTLGAFDDPLLSTFIAWPEADLARLLFHELAHQLVYVKGDSTFNESFAVALEREGVRRWLVAGGRDAELRRHLESRQRAQEFTRLLEATRAQLASLYASKIAPEAMRERKHAALAALAAHPTYQRGASRVATLPNNALLAAHAVYTRRVPAFERMLAAFGGDLEKLYTEVRALAALDKSERDRRLAGYETAMSTTLR